MKPNLGALVQKAETSHSLTLEELAALIASDDPGVGTEIFAAADRVRKKYVGDEVHLRGLIEFSNICKQNCLYCGLRCQNSKISRYRMEPEQITAVAERAAGLGYRTLVLQSGEDPYYDAEIMRRIISEVKRLDVAITLSIGEKTREEYQAYYDAGANRYLLRIETSNRRLYETLDPKMSFENRVECLRHISDIGYEVGTGCLVGIPGQTPEDLAADILFFIELGADMVGLGPFIPNPDTPLAGEKGGTFEAALKMMSLTRLLMPDINIPATTAMEALNPKGRLIALQSGANVVMPNVNDSELKQMYLLYPGKICLNDNASKCAGCITGKIHSIGRTVSSGYGFSRSSLNRKISQG